MKKIIILCLTTCAFVSNHSIFGMLTNKYRTLTQHIAFSTKIHGQPSDLNLPELLNNLKAEKIDIEKNIEFVKDMIQNDSHLSDSEKTIAFKSTDRIFHLQEIMDDIN